MIPGRAIFMTKYFLLLFLNIPAHKKITHGFVELIESNKQKIAIFIGNHGKNSIISLQIQDFEKVPTLIIEDRNKPVGSVHCHVSIANKFFAIFDETSLCQNYQDLTLK